MGNELSKQVQHNGPNSPYGASGFCPNQGPTYAACHPNERYFLGQQHAKETLPWKSRGIAQESPPKGPKRIAHPDSGMHDQRPFINYHKEENDGLRITAAFSLNYSSHYSCPDSTRKAPPAQSSEEFDFPSMQRDFVSELLPGGLIAVERERWKSDLSTQFGQWSHTYPRRTLQDRKGTAYKKSFKFSNSHSAFPSKPNAFYMRSGSEDPTSSSTSNFTSDAIWSVEKPSDNWKPVTDLLWSYQPTGRPQGDTTIPVFPTMSYGDRLPFDESMTSSKRARGLRHEAQQDYVKNPKMPRLPDSENVFYEMSEKPTGRRSHPAHKKPEYMPREEIVRRPFDYSSFDQSHRLNGSINGQSSWRNSLCRRESLLFNDLEDNNLRDMRCRGMPSSFSIGYPNDAATLRQGSSPIGRPSNLIDWSQAHNDSFGFAGSAYPKEQPRSFKEIIHGPLSNSPDEQLTRTLPFSEVHSVHKRSRAAEMEPSRTRQSPLVPHLHGGSLHHRDVSYDHHWEAINPQAKGSTRGTRHTDTQTHGEGITPMSFHKPEELDESTAAKFRSSQSSADHAKIPLDVSSEVLPDYSRSWSTNTNPTSRPTTDIIKEPKINLKPEANTTNQEEGSDSFICSPAGEPSELQIKREQLTSACRTSCPAVTSTVVHSDCKVQKPTRKQRFDWERFTLSLQKKTLTETLSNETQPPKSSERSFISEDISPEEVVSDSLLAESSQISTFETEGVDSSSNADSSNGTVDSSYCLASYEDSTDEENAIFIQEKTDEGLEGNQPTTKKPTCEICGKTFTRNNTLISHQRIHSGARPYSCDQCGRAFRQQGNLTRHMLTHTCIKNHTCSYCNKKFSRASNLHTHMRIHTNYRPFKCDMCEKSFYQKMDLKVHRYTHTGEKPHVCSKCGKGFKQVTHLKYHLRIHSDVRMFTCEYCGKGFNQKGNLQAHIYGHTGDRPHKCDVCGKAFTLASTLNTHKRTHAATKPYECKFCSKAYYQKNALKTHYISTHPFTSGYCNV